jgi:hypothetical protein
MEMFIHFQVPCDDVAGKIDHILRTPETASSCYVEPLGRGKDPALRVSPRIFLPFQAPFLPDL